MEPTHEPRRHRNLTPSTYSESGKVCFVTVLTHYRLPIFAEPGIASAAVAALKRRSAATGVAVLGYCLMPDHLHIVVQPSPECDVISFVAQVKNRIQHEARKRGHEGHLWQEGFWDSRLGDGVSTKALVEHVLNSPVRRGIARRWRDYSYAGSTIHEALVA